MRVEELTIDETVQILRGLRDRYEAHHRVKISDDGPRLAVLADRYIQDRHLPDKAIDLIDEAARGPHSDDVGAAALPRARGGDRDRSLRQGSTTRPRSSRRLASLRDKERKLTQKKKELERWRNEADEEQPEIGEDEIVDIVSMWTGIPVFKLTEAESQKLVRMEEELHKRVIGQETAIVAVSKAIRRAGGDQGPEAPDRAVHLPRPLGRREDRDRPDARRVPLRRRGR